MKLRVDGTPFVRDRIDGIARYSIEVLKNTKISSDNLTFVCFIDDNTDLITEAFPKARIKKIWLPRRVWSLLFRVGLTQIIPRPNALSLHTNFTTFPYPAKKSIVVVHDLAYIDQPETVSAKNRTYLEKHVPKSIQSADGIVAVSSFTKQRLTEVYGVDAAKITVVPNGVDADLFSKPASVELLKELAVTPKEYLLFVGSLEPRKNLDKILEAYGLLPDSLRKKYPLVLVGASGWNNEGIGKKIQDMISAGENIITPGYVGNEELVALYQNSSCFVFPSQYEGFGIPVLEAMAAGAPVITSDISPLNEVAGDAALLVDPSDSHQIASSIEALVTDQKKREKCISAGYQNVKKYSWTLAGGKLRTTIDKLSANNQ